MWLIFLCLDTATKSVNNPHPRSIAPERWFRYVCGMEKEDMSSAERDMIGVLAMFSPNRPMMVSASMYREMEKISALAHMMDRVRENKRIPLSK